MTSRLVLPELSPYLERLRHNHTELQEKYPLFVWTNQRMDLQKHLLSMSRVLHEAEMKEAREVLEYGWSCIQNTINPCLKGKELEVNVLYITDPPNVEKHCCFTLGNTIFMPGFRADILVHELVHVTQRLFTKDWMRHISMNDKDWVLVGNDVVESILRDHEEYIVDNPDASVTNMPQYLYRERYWAGSSRQSHSGIVVDVVQNKVLFGSFSIDFHGKTIPMNHILELYASVGEACMDVS